MEIVLQSLDEGDFLAIFVLHRIDVAQGTVGGADGEGGAVDGFHSLGLQDAVTVLFGEPYHGDDGVVFQALSVIVDIGVAKVQIAASAAADVGAGQLATFKEGLQHEGLAAGHAVDINKGEGVIRGNAEGHVMLGKFRLEGSHAVCHGHADFAPAQVFIGERYAGDVDIFQHALGKGLQEHFATIIGSLLIVSLLTGDPAELAAGGHENQLGVAGDFLLDGPGYFRYGKIGGDEAHDESSAASQVTEVFQLVAGELVPIEVDSFDVLLAADSGHGHGRGGMHPLSGSRGRCRSGFRGSVLLVFGEKTKHCANTSFIPG